MAGLPPQPSNQMQGPSNLYLLPPPPKIEVPPNTYFRILESYANSSSLLYREEIELEKQGQEAVSTFRESMQVYVVLTNGSALLQGSIPFLNGAVYLLMATSFLGGLVISLLMALWKLKRMRWWFQDLEDRQSALFTEVKDMRLLINQRYSEDVENPAQDGNTVYRMASFNRRAEAIEKSMEGGNKATRYHKHHTTMLWWKAIGVSIHGLILPGISFFVFRSNNNKKKRVAENMPELRHPT